MTTVNSDLLQASIGVGPSSADRRLFVPDEVPVSHDHDEVVHVSQAEVRERIADREGEADGLAKLYARCRLIEPKPVVLDTDGFPVAQNIRDLVWREPAKPVGKVVVGVDGILRHVTEAEQASTGGVKHDQGKDPWGLLPYDAVRCVVKVLAFGARKYAPRNWEKGMDWSRCFEAAQRHLTAWWMKENGGKDEDTGYSHLWHAATCILFLVAYELRGVGRDDRPGS